MAAAQRSAVARSRVAAQPARTGTAKVAPRRSAPPKSKLAAVVSQSQVSRTGRRLVYSMVFLVGLVMVGMFLAVVAQTRIAENQLRLDQIEQEIVAERNRYDELRLERSSLREPARLVVEARALGMAPGLGTDFTSVDPATVAAVLVSTGGVDPELLSVERDPLENYGRVKSLIGDRG